MEEAERILSCSHLKLIRFCTLLNSVPLLFVWLRYDVDFTPAQLALDQLVDDEARQLSTQRQREATGVAISGDDSQVPVEPVVPSAASGSSAARLPEPEPESEQGLEPERAMNGLPRTASAASAQSAAADLSAAMVCTTEQFYLTHLDFTVQTSERIPFL